MQSILYSIYCLLIFCLGGEQPIIADTPKSLKILGSFAVFALVFTLNQCYYRFNEAVHCSTELFAKLLNINTVCCSYIGTLKTPLDSLGPDQLRLMVATQAHVARLSLALAGAFAVQRYVIETVVTGKTLSDDSNESVLFELVRMRGLLLETEMPLIESCTGLLMEKRTSAGCCQAEKTKHRLCTSFWYKSGRLGPDLKPLFPFHRIGYGESAGEDGSPEDHIQAGDVVGVSLMLPLMALLRHYISLAISQPWGFPERFVNLFEAELQKIVSLIDDLEQLVSIQLPMAYMQQRKALFFAFVVVYPMTLPNSDGWWTNVITPSLIFMAMQGFEAVAEMLENPLGNDALDIDVGEQIHTLEVRIMKMFRISEERLGLLQAASAEMMSHMPLDSDREIGAEENAQKISNRHLLSKWGFDAHFAWRPVPPQILVRTMSQMHAMGEAADEQMQRLVNARHLDYSSGSESSEASEEGPGAQWSPVARRMSQYHHLERGSHKPTSSSTVLASISMNRNLDQSLGRKDLVAIDHFLCLRSRSSSIDIMLEEFGREYVKSKRRKGRSGLLLDRLHAVWWEKGSDSVL